MSPIAMLVKQVELVWWSVLRGDTPRGMQQMFDIMRAPVKIDDLVLIGSVHPNTPAEDRIGWLVKVEDAPWQPWDGDEPAPLARYWTIERLSDAAPVRWTNVQVLRVIQETRSDNVEPITRASSDRTHS
jgi:hypothetical protein